MCLSGQSVRKIFPEPTAGLLSRIISEFSKLNNKAWMLVCILPFRLLAKRTSPKKYAKSKVNKIAYIPNISTHSQ